MLKAATKKTRKGIAPLLQLPQHQKEKLDSRPQEPMGTVTLQHTGGKGWCFLSAFSLGPFDPVPAPPYTWPHDGQAAALDVRCILPMSTSGHECRGGRSSPNFGREIVWEFHQEANSKRVYTSMSWSTV